MKYVVIEKVEISFYYNYKKHFNKLNNKYKHALQHKHRSLNFKKINHISLWKCIFFFNSIDLPIMMVLNSAQHT